MHSSSHFYSIKTNYEWLDPSRKYVGSLNRSSYNAKQKNKFEESRQEPFWPDVPIAGDIPVLVPSNRLCPDQTLSHGI